MYTSFIYLIFTEFNQKYIPILTIKLTAVISVCQTILLTTTWKQCCFPKVHICILYIKNLYDSFLRPHLLCPKSNVWNGINIHLGSPPVFFFLVIAASINGAWRMNGEINGTYGLKNWFLPGHSQDSMMDCFQPFCSF